MSSRLVQREYFRSRARLDSQFLADAGKNFLLVAITSLISTLAALGIAPNAIIVGGVGAATLGAASWGATTIARYHLIKRRDSLM